MGYWERCNSTYAIEAEVYHWLTVPLASLYPGFSPEDLRLINNFGLESLDLDSLHCKSYGAELVMAMRELNLQLNPILESMLLNTPYPNDRDRSFLNGTGFTQATKEVLSTIIYPIASNKRHCLLNNIFTGLAYDSSREMFDPDICYQKCVNITEFPCSKNLERVRSLLKFNGNILLFDILINLLDPSCDIDSRYQFNFDGTNTRAMQDTCTATERHFVETLSMPRQNNVLTYFCGEDLKPVFIEKTYGYGNQLALNLESVTINGVSLPAGTVFYVVSDRNLYKEHEFQYFSSIQYIDISGILYLYPLKISRFAIQEPFPFRDDILYPDKICLHSRYKMTDFISAALANTKMIRD